MSKSSIRPLIVALDVESERDALQLTRHLSPWVDIFKVGPVLFLKGGAALIRNLQKLGAQIFLDLKFHDIPSVVRRALERAGEWGVYSATVHTSGGMEMLKQATAATKRPRLWGVTVLTSLDQGDLSAMGVRQSLEEQVIALAAQAKQAGLEGVIASGSDARRIKSRLGQEFTVVTPGMRWGPAADDQKRSQTPWTARRQGADFVVVGRPVIEAQDPVYVVKEIYQQWNAQH